MAIFIMVIFNYEKIDVYYNTSDNQKKKNYKYYCSSIVDNKKTIKEHLKIVINDIVFLKNKDVRCFFDHDYNK